MNFTDMIKKSVLEGFSNDINIADILISLAVAFVAGLFILVIYRLTYKGVSRSRSFETTLILMTPISAMIVLTITSNLALSLGMVGALSVIRFRTAIKEASDTAFMFWAVAAGITAGAHFYKITLIGSLFIGALTFIIVKLTSVSTRPYLLVIKATDKKAIEAAEMTLEHMKVTNRVSSITTTEGVTEAIFEVAMTSATHKVVNAISALEFVESVAVVDCRN